MTQFGTLKNKGFHLTFENGLTISIQFGDGNYCNNQYSQGSKPYGFEMSQNITTCENAEVAIWDKNKNWYTFNQDEKDDEMYFPEQVKGWLEPDQVAVLILKVKMAKSLTDLHKLIKLC